MDVYGVYAEHGVGLIRTDDGMVEGWIDKVKDVVDDMISI